MKCKDCTECYKVENDEHEIIGHVCMDLKNGVGAREITYLNDCPDWCPLKDVKS